MKSNPTLEWGELTCWMTIDPGVDGGVVKTGMVLGEESSTVVGDARQLFFDGFLFFRTLSSLFFFSSSPVNVVNSKIKQNIN